MKSYILDACAIIAFICDEKGADKIEKLLLLSSQKKCQIFINKINLLEIFYNFHKEYDAETLNEAFSRVLNLPMEILHSLSDEVFYEAGKLKSKYRISLADSIVLAEAKIKNAQVVTADHHEFDIIDKSGLVKFFWIR